MRNFVKELTVMKIFTIGESAVRPRILLIDFEKSDAQALRDCGYKVYMGSSGLKDGSFNIPIEPYRIDIVIYRVAYEAKIPEPNETLELYSMVEVRRDYKLRDDKSGQIHYKVPSLAPASKCNFGNDILTLRDEVLSKGGSILVFIGNRRIEEDEIIMRRLVSAKNYSIYKTGGPEKEYELSFACDTSVQKLGNYFKDLITGKTGHYLDFLRGFRYLDLALDYKDYPNKSVFRAFDESQVFYCYFENRGDRGNLMFLPDFGSIDIEIIKNVLAILPTFSPKVLFSKEYQEGAWLEGEQFKFSDELDIIQQKDATKKAFESKQDELEAARIKARSSTDDFRAILTNGDDDKSEKDEQLKPPLKKVLEWLEIEVIDLDDIQKDKDEPLINDFILKAEGKEILCEAKGVTTGPRSDYVTQVNKHIVRFSKLTQEPALPGLLILNYQRDVDPNKRSEFYSDPAVIREAEESDIGLLDTRELFKMCRRIYSSEHEKELKKKAREAIFSVGVIKCWPDA